MNWKYIVKRLLFTVIVYIILVFVYSVIFNATLEQTIRSEIRERIQGEIMAMTDMPAEQIQAYREDRLEQEIIRYDLHRPQIQRILLRTKNTLTFNFGKATIMRSRARETDAWLIVKERIPRTVILFTTATALNVLIGILLGIKKAQKAGSTFDKGTSVGTMVVIGMPSWWLGMILIMFFAYTVPIFPSGGIRSTPPVYGFAGFLDQTYHMILPVLTLVAIGFWRMSYLTRNIVLSTLQEDYIMSARARGIPEKSVLYGHALRSSAPPMLTMAIMALIASIFGNIVFEGIFSWPGMGQLYWTAVQQNDVPVQMTLLSVLTLMQLIALAILDIIYGLLDPRIKVGDRK